MFKVCASVVAFSVLTSPSGCDSLPPPPDEPEAAQVDSSSRRTGQMETGEMSWYSVKTNRGTKTASGEKLTDHELTAAHRTLPFGTLVEVTNLRNGRSEIVRINDRGPFIAGRIIDVSISAAKKLDFAASGVAPCQIEVILPDL